MTYFQQYEMSLEMLKKTSSLHLHMDLTNVTTQHVIKTEWRENIFIFS